MTDIDKENVKFLVAIILAAAILILVAPWVGVVLSRYFDWVSRLV